MEKNKKYIINLASAEFAQRVVKIKVNINMEIPGKATTRERSPPKAPNKALMTGMASQNKPTPKAERTIQRRAASELLPWNGEP